MNNNGNDNDNDNESREPRRILVESNSKTKIHDAQFDNDILIVVSKLKKYIKEKHGLSTSSDVTQKLSDIVRVSCDRAIDNTMKDDRKTLMARDF